MEILKNHYSSETVSYTHLDVYKRQSLFPWGKLGDPTFKLVLSSSSPPQETDSSYVTVFDTHYYVLTNII